MNDLYLKTMVPQFEKSMEEFIDGLDSCVVDDLVRYDLGETPVLIKAVELVSQWKMLENFGAKFSSDLTRWTALDDNIDSLM